MLLDTSLCVDLLREQARGDTGPATRAVASLGEEAVSVPVFVACELEAGAALSRNAGRERKRVRAFLELVNVVYPDARFAAIYGETEARLRAAGTPVPTMDLLIGTICLVAGSAILTRDARYFAVIPGLEVATYSEG